METTFKCYGTPLPFPLVIDADWVRIQCGVDGNPNFIFGTEGVEQFYKAGAGIYTREKGKPKDSLQYWINWYQNERSERIKTYALIQDIKKLVRI
jgi:hypothetical protein